MIDSAITLVGSLIETPEPRTSTSGLVVTSFRLASTTRRFDRERGRWVDGATTFITVACWRQLAENAICSLRRGDRVLVAGRLRQRVYHLEDGTRRATVEIEADAIGPDLCRHVVQVRRPARERIPIPGVENDVRRPTPAEVPPCDPVLRSTAETAGMEGIPVPASGVPLPPAPRTGSGPAAVASEDRSSPSADLPPHPAHTANGSAHADGAVVAGDARPEGREPSRARGEPGAAAAEAGRTGAPERISDRANGGGESP